MLYERIEVTLEYNFALRKYDFRGWWFATLKNRGWSMRAKGQTALKSRGGSLAVSKRQCPPPRAPTPPDLSPHLQIHAPPERFSTTNETVSIVNISYLLIFKTRKHLHVEFRKVAKRGIVQYLLIMFHILQMTVSLLLVSACLEYKQGCKFSDFFLISDFFKNDKICQISCHYIRKSSENVRFYFEICSIIKCF